MFDIIKYIILTIITIGGIYSLFLIVDALIKKWVDKALGDNDD